MSAAVDPVRIKRNLSYIHTANFPFSVFQRFFFCFLCIFSFDNILKKVFPPFLLFLLYSWFPVQFWVGFHEICECLLIGKLHSWLTNQTINRRRLPLCVYFIPYRFLPVLHAMSIAEVPDVQIDDEGIYKYILIRATDKQGESKNLVRGFATAGFHADILDATEKQLLPKGIQLDCLGGGRIEKSNKTISVYGHSIGFGRADHQVTVAILKKSFPGYNITWSNDGYWAPCYFIFGRSELNEAGNCFVHAQIPWGATETFSLNLNGLVLRRLCCFGQLIDWLVEWVIRCLLKHQWIEWWFDWLADSFCTAGHKYICTVYVLFVCM